MIQRIALLALVASISLGSASDPVTGPAGVYSVTTTGPTRVTSGDGWVRIEWDIEPSIPAKPPEPVKPPDPGPTNPPKPPEPVTIGPLAAPIWIAAVFDKATAGSLPKPQQDLLLSKAIAGELAALGATWSSWDKSDKGLKDWGPDAGSTYPVLLVIWDAGRKSKTFPLPGDEAAAVSFVKQIVGKQ